MLSSTVAILHDNSTHGEDHYLVRDLDNHAVLDAVMDGVTNSKGKGQEASQAVGEALARADINSADDITCVLETVNTRLFRDGWGRFLQTTVSVTLALDTTLYAVSAGDSPILLIRGDKVQQLYSRPIDFITQGIARALGTRQPLGNLYRAEATLEPGDRLLVATDGVTDNVTRSELVMGLCNATSPQEAAQRLKALIDARYRNGCLPEKLGSRYWTDDRTAIIRFFNAAG